MNGSSHRKVTAKVLALCAERGLNTRQDAVIEVAVATDVFRDLEFVDVDSGRNENPHIDEGDEDEAHYDEFGQHMTSFNHFMDIKKGEGMFDDYDGYSYYLGSASHEEYQDFTEVTDIWYVDLVEAITGDKVDEQIAEYYDDEYIHIPGQGGYNNCSSSVIDYSYWQEKDIYRNAQEEAQHRFPLAESHAEENTGIPYSVFMPLDNLARYWYEEHLSIATKPENVDVGTMNSAWARRWPGFETMNKPQSGIAGAFASMFADMCLGVVFHALQDASIPHHAAGYMGNWHDRYEADLDKLLDTWLDDYSLMSEAQDLADEWLRAADDPNPPGFQTGQSGQVKESSTPAQNWRIDHIVTWIALHAYNAYSQTYDNFQKGYCIDEANARELTKFAMAACILVINKSRADIKASKPKKPIVIEGGDTHTTRELTKEEMREAWEMMSLDNQLRIMEERRGSLRNQ